jgi:hypothetical protein
MLHPRNNGAMRPPMTLPKKDVDPKAVACYGILRADT